MNEAFGSPGNTPVWTTGAKSGVGTSASSTSRVWFTFSQGIMNEVYYPRVDTANIRDAQFLVTAESFFSEEKRDTVHKMSRLDMWSPAFQLTNTCISSRYRRLLSLCIDLASYGEYGVP
jgi:glucoamylase